MLMPILTLLSALSISGVAIFYSVIGLATIFPGAFWPVVIMGSVLEVGKLITASWVYRNWKFTPWLLKSYLVIAVIILSFITSMGIFGFLSKAHLEQNLAEDTVTQRIEIINSKIQQEEIYIDRQKNVIERAEKDLNRTSSSNTEALNIETQSLKDAEKRFQTLLAVETNTIKELNARMTQLDKDVSDVLTANKQFFNEERAAAELKASQKAERENIDSKIAQAQVRIDSLKQDYIKDTAVIQKRIDNLRSGGVEDKSGVSAQITSAEDNIFAAQNRIDGLIIEREPLQAKILKLEAEVGPIKYIAALATDWGIADEVNTSAAVRWVILIIIVVFDPLAVLLLIAANQSLVKRFPVKAPRPQEIVDLEKPDEEDVTLKWNEMISKAKEEAAKENAEKQLKEWKSKLEVFNAKVPKPEEKPVEIIQEEDSTVPHIELKGAIESKDGFDPAEVEGYEEFNKKYEETKEEQLERFKQREKEEQENLERIAREAREEEPTLSEQIEEVMEPERIKPDFTEVIEPEKAVTGALGQVIVDKKGKAIQPPKPELTDPAEMTDDERKQMLDRLHNLHGKFEDISDTELKKERDESNKAQFLADVSLTLEEAQAQPAITESRMAFFQDVIDDILRGDTTFENVPEENKKIIAQIMDPEMPNPQIITKGSALKPEGEYGIEKTTAEGLKEKFMAEPKTEERPMTDEELDQLLEGWEEEQKPKAGEKTKMIIRNGKRIFVPVEDKPKAEYVQNEEQNDQTLWQKSKELDIPEPEKNEIILPPMENTIEEENIADMADDIKVEQSIPQEKFTNYKKRVTSGEDYHSRIEQRIDDLIIKLENKEIKLEDLTEEDKKVIMDILNQNG
jgi:hypothetical protein